MDGTARARLINLIHLKEGNTYWASKETLTSYFKNVWCEKDLPTVSESFDYIWTDSKNSKNVTNEFLEKVQFISGLLKCDPDDLMAAMSFETSGYKKLSLSDIYMAILAQKAVGKPDAYAVYSKGEAAHSANSGLDLNKDGVITKFEAAEMVRQQQARYKPE